MNRHTDADSGSFSYQTKGLYLSHSAVSQLGLSFLNNTELARKLLQEVPGSHHGYSGWKFRSDVEIGLDEAIPLLVREHERHHYQQLMSTPVGLLTWRIMNTLTAGVLWIVRTLALTPATEGCELPITDWYFSGGREAIERNPPQQSNRYYRSVLEHLDEVFFEVQILERFLAAFLGRQSLSTHQFVSLANQALPFLERASDLHYGVRWATRSAEAQGYVGTEHFSLTEIVEASARFYEHRMLGQDKSTKALLKDWKERSIHGVYKPAYEWLWREFRNPYFAGIAIDVAMNSPIDPVCAEAVGGRIYVEDVLPGWRLPKITKAMKQVFWSPNLQEQDQEVLEGIARRAGLPTPKRTLLAALPKPFDGPRSWHNDSRSMGKPENETTAEAFHYTQAEVRRAFKLRLRDPLVFVGLRGGGEHEVFRPALEMFADQALFNDNPVTTASPYLHITFYLHLVTNLTCLSLLGDGDLSDVPRIQKSFEGAFRNRGFLDQEIEGMREYWNACTWVPRFLGPNLSKLVYW